MKEFLMGWALVFVVLILLFFFAGLVVVLGACFISLSLHPAFMALSWIDWKLLRCVTVSAFVLGMLMAIPR